MKPQEERMQNSMRRRLAISDKRLEEINSVLLNPDMRVINDFLDVVGKYGTPEEINQKASDARHLPTLFERIINTKPEFLDDLKWLEEQRDKKAFISIPAYRRKVLGDQVGVIDFNDDLAVTLEISACQYFPWVTKAAKRAIDQGSLMPGRFIRVRKMKEQEADGDLPAFAAAMQIIGASYVETLDTKGTGGVGQPNEYALKWIDEFLYYYTQYGVRQVLNVNPGTIFLGYMLHKLGIDIEFKISVFVGNDNPYAAFWTLIGAKLFMREDGTSPLIGFNWSNSTNNETMEITAQFRKDFDFEQVVRFEHHIVETYKSIVRQPYNRREELLEIAGHVANISAKHEGGDPEIDQTRDHPSDILDYFRDKDEIISSGDWDHLTLNFLDKFDSTNKTAWDLTTKGFSFIAATELHHRDE
jgi:hypothetical protein